MYTTSPFDDFNTVPGILRNPALLCSNSLCMARISLSVRSLFLRARLNPTDIASLYSSTSLAAALLICPFIARSALYNSSEVVTIFSTAELSNASCKTKVLISIFSLGMVKAIPFNSANRRLAAFTCLNTTFVSKSYGRGNCGILYFCSIFCFTVYGFLYQMYS